MDNPNKLDAESFRKLNFWLIEHLENISPADPIILAKYVVSMFEIGQSESYLKKKCQKQLQVFLENETSQFVELLFSVLKSKAYLNCNIPKCLGNYSQINTTSSNQSNSSSITAVDNENLNHENQCKLIINSDYNSSNNVDNEIVQPQMSQLSNEINSNIHHHSTNTSHSIFPSDKASHTQTMFKNNETTLNCIQEDRYKHVGDEISLNQDSNYKMTTITSTNKYSPTSIQQQKHSSNVDVESSSASVHKQQQYNNNPFSPLKQPTSTEHYGQHDKSLKQQFNDNRNKRCNKSSSPEASSNKKITRKRRRHHHRSRDSPRRYRRTSSKMNDDIDDSSSYCSSCLSDDRTSPIANRITNHQYRSRRNSFSYRGEDDEDSRSTSESGRAQEKSSSHTKSSWHQSRSSKDYQRSNNNQYYNKKDSQHRMSRVRSRSNRDNTRDYNRSNRNISSSSRYSHSENINSSSRKYNRSKSKSITKFYTKDVDLRPQLQTVSINEPTTSTLTFNDHQNDKEINNERNEEEMNVDASTNNDKPEQENCEVNSHDLNCPEGKNCNKGVYCTFYIVPPAKKTEEDLKTETLASFFMEPYNPETSLDAISFFNLHSSGSTTNAAGMFGLISNQTNLTKNRNLYMNLSKKVEQFELQQQQQQQPSRTRELVGVAMVDDTKPNCKSSHRHSNKKRENIIDIMSSCNAENEDYHQSSIKDHQNNDNNKNQKSSNIYKNENSQFVNEMLNPYVSLLVKNIPRNMNNITLLNEHFSKFGIVNYIEVCYQNDPETALIRFGNFIDANNAFRTREAVFNNRFIKVYWANGPPPASFLKQNLKEEASYKKNRNINHNNNNHNAHGQKKYFNLTPKLTKTAFSFNNKTENEFEDLDDIIKDDDNGDNEDNNSYCSSSTKNIYKKCSNNIEQQNETSNYLPLIERIKLRNDLQKYKFQLSELITNNRLLLEKLKSVKTTNEKQRIIKLYNVNKANVEDLTEKISKTQETLKTTLRTTKVNNVSTSHTNTAPRMPYHFAGGQRKSISNIKKFNTNKMASNNRIKNNCYNQNKFDLINDFNETHSNKQAHFEDLTSNQSYTAASQHLDNRSNQHIDDQDEDDEDFDNDDDENLFKTASRINYD